MLTSGDVDGSVESGSRQKTLEMYLKSTHCVTNLCLLSWLCYQGSRSGLVESTFSPRIRAASSLAPPPVCRVSPQLSGSRGSEPPVCVAAGTEVCSGTGCQ